MSAKMSCSKGKNQSAIPTLSELCQERILRILERNKFNPRLINDLCKSVPDQRLLEPVLERLLEKKNAITDQALLAFLVPSRTQLLVQGLQTIKNSTFRLIGYNCPNLRVLNLSDCDKVSNSVVRGILQGCHSLEHLKLDRCSRVTDASFDVHQSPFHTLVGCISLKSISLQGCPQVTGHVVKTINSICGSLRYLNLSQCRNAQTCYLKEIFMHEKLCALNLSYIEALGDEVFDFNGGASDSSRLYTHQLQKIHIGKSAITDKSLIQMSTCFRDLIEVRFQWCSSLGDEGVVSLVKSCTRLCVVDLKSSAITDISLHAIAACCKELKVLDVSWCSAITDGAFAFFAADEIESALRSVDEPAFDDDDDFLSLLFDMGSQAEIASQMPLPLLKKREDYSSSVVSGTSSRLQKLMIEWCPLLTDALLPLLRAMPSLRSVDAMGCAGITAEAADQFNAVSGAIVNV